MKTKSQICLLSVLTIMLAGCGDANQVAPSVKIQEMKVSPSDLVLEVGEVFTLEVDVLPENADAGTVLWESSDGDVVQVNSVTGEVTAIAEGSAVVSATETVSGKNAVCSIVVYVPEPEYVFVHEGTDAGEDGAVTISWGITADGILVISGSGGMRIYDIQSSNSVVSTNAPWFEFSDEILSIVIENGITTAGRYAFAGLPYVQNVSFGRDVTHIRIGAFYECPALTAVEIPSGITIIDNYAFYCNSSLENVIIEDGSMLDVVGGCAFYHCAELRSIVLPDGVTVIGDSAFDGCEKMEDAYIGRSLEQISFNTFKDYRLLKSIAIPDGVTEICNQAFSNCRSLTELIIPNSVRYIDNSAFYRCVGLKTVTLGSGVLSIGAYAFNLCNNLKDVIVMAAAPPELVQMTAGGSDEYYNFNYENDVLHVPSGCLDAYSNDPVWSASFSDIVEL